MIITKKALSRRTFLRGAGAAVALPLLDSMLPAATPLARTAAKPVPRLSYVYLPMGTNLPLWLPAEQGRLTRFSPILESLTPHLRAITVVSNLDLKNAYSAGNHATANSAFLSAARAKMTEGSDFELATTIDQVAARHFGGDTLLPSLEVAMDLNSITGNCDNGYACVYQNNLSWANARTPLPPEAHPRVVFERLFGTGESPVARRADFRKDASILDWVREDLRRLERDLGVADRSTVSDYLESVREVERRVQNAERRISDSPAPDSDRPDGVPAAFGDHAKLMFDLQVLALRGDVTRVLTFQLARELSNRSYPEIGVAEGHHTSSHHANNPVKVANLTRINKFHVSLFGHYLDRLAATPDGDGTLLDHTLILCGSGMGNPDVHNHTDLPILLAGGRGAHRGGRHIRYAQPVPLANLHLTMMHQLGVPLDSFSDSTGVLGELNEKVL